jgi:ribonuclease P/MRP protein subunit RPP40
VTCAYIPLPSNRLAYFVYLKKKQTCACALGPSNTFDSVVRTKLLVKLKYVGIGGKLLSWISEFLFNRSQVVKVGSQVSTVATVISGVPQGSVLGPLLFIIFINDIVDIFGDGLTVKLFADDVKIYLVLDEICNHGKLQRGLENLRVWADIWQQKISVPKCSVLHLGSTNPGHSYLLNGQQLPDVNSARDLGVVIDQHLRFSVHINEIVIRAQQRSALVLRCFRSRDPVLLFRAFSAYIRPILEYCSPVWSTCYITDIIKIESVQRRFTKRLAGLSALSYADRLTKLNVESLELRRLKADLLLHYKLTHCLMNLAGDVTVFMSHETKTRGHDKRISKPHSKYNCRAFSFACRSVNAWNSLPQCVVNAGSVFNLKKWLKLG